MSGTGKYTKYVPPNSARRTFLEKLFSASPYVGLEQSAAAVQAAENGNTYLIPSVQSGDLLIFPEGVSLDYAHENSPNFDDVRWQRRGDPANAYTPDIIAPGPGVDGEVNLSPRDVDPGLSPNDIKPNFVPGVGGTYADGGGSTVNPAVTTQQIASTHVLGVNLKPGSSTEKA